MKLQSRFRKPSCRRCDRMALSRGTPVQISQTRLPLTLSLACHFLVELRSRFRKPCFAASESAWCQPVFFFSQICGVGALASLAFFSCGEFVFQKFNIISNTSFFKSKYSPRFYTFSKQVAMIFKNNNKFLLS